MTIPFYWLWFKQTSLLNVSTNQEQTRAQYKALVKQRMIVDDT